MEPLTPSTTEQAELEEFTAAMTRLSNAAIRKARVVSVFRDDLEAMFALFARFSTLEALVTDVEADMKRKEEWIAKASSVFTRLTTDSSEPCSYHAEAQECLTALASWTAEPEANT